MLFDIMWSLLRYMVIDCDFVSTFFYVFRIFMSVFSRVLPINLYNKSKF